MNPALALSLLSTIIQETPAAVALFNQISAMLQPGAADPTQEQMQALLAAMAAAHSKVQAA